MAQGKQAKIILPRQEAAILKSLQDTRHPERDRVMFLLSVKAGLRAKEIACLTWAMVTDSAGDITTSISIDNKSSKGSNGGRNIPMNAKLRKALIELQSSVNDRRQVLDHPVIYSERERGLSAQAVVNWFTRLYDNLGYNGCSSHSGRRTFITRAANKVIEAGGSLRDVQYLAGHTSLAMTQKYIDSDTDVHRKLVDLV